MKVAVSGMKDVADAQAMFFRHTFNELQYGRNFRAGHHTVLRIVRRSESTERGKGVLTAFPEQHSLVLVFCASNFARVLLKAYFSHCLCLFFDLLGKSFQFDQQHCAGVEGITRMASGLYGAQGPPIEHFEGCRSNASGGDCRHGFRTVVDGLEDAEQGSDALGSSQQANGDLGDNTDRSLRTDEEPSEVVTIALYRFSTEVHNLAAGHDYRKAGHVVYGDAVSQSMRTSGVFGYVTTDCAGFLAGRIGRKVKPEVCHIVG